MGAIQDGRAPPCGPARNKTAKKAEIATTGSAITNAMAAAKILVTLALKNFANAILLAHVSTPELRLTAKRFGLDALSGRPALL